MRGRICSESPNVRVTRAMAPTGKAYRDVAAVAALPLPAAAEVANAARVSGKSAIPARFGVVEIVSMTRPREFGHQLTSFGLAS